MKDGIEPILVVDLDGTLLRSDILYETFWSSFGKDWRTPVFSVAAVVSGRARLKRYLAASAHLDVSLLPYDPALIAYIKDWRLHGGRTALVTASDQEVAGRIADHLGIFDEVYGSDGAENLKGSVKADFLTKRFGAEGYLYMGDAAADLPVWQKACKVITVNASATLKTQTGKIGKEVEHLSTVQKSLRPYFRAMRPHQWLKNILVFVPMLAAHEVEVATLVQSSLAFFAFCGVASSVYVLNDLLDLAADRTHPRKRFRPFASGSVPIAHGSWMAAGLLLLGLGIGAGLGWQFLVVIIGYYALTVAYSLKLKQLIVIDICVLAGLYTIRILAGSAATNIQLSMWLFGFSTFFFFSLAALKRQAELVDAVERGVANANGRGYQVADLPIVSMIALGSGYVSVLVMALYANSPTVRELYAHPHALAGICAILLYWVTYMVMITHRGLMHDDPIVFAAKDRKSQICFFLTAAYALVGALM